MRTLLRFFAALAFAPAVVHAQAPLFDSVKVAHDVMIRVDISSSNFPRFDVNPGMGEPLGRNRRMVTQDNTVYHSARYPSHIVLPLAPAVR